MKIPVITLWEPWATLCALAGHPDPEIRKRAKHFETRNWTTKYRGKIAIHSAKTMPQEAQHLASNEEPFRSVLAMAGYKNMNDFPRGKIIAIGNLVDVIRVDLVGKNFIVEKGKKSKVVRFLSINELAFGDYSAGRFAWLLEDMQIMPEPVPAKGHQGLWWWNVPEDLKYGRVG